MRNSLSLLSPSLHIALKGPGSVSKKILAFHPKRSSYAKTSHALMIIIATPQALKMLRGKVAIFKLLLNKVIKLNLQ